MAAPPTILDNRVYNEMIFLTEKYETAETPAGLIDLELFPHQKTILQALIRLEDARAMTVTGAVVHNLTGRPVTLHSTSFTLSEAFGSGKTFEILAFILARPIPRAFSYHLNCSVIGGKTKQQRQSAFTHELLMRVGGANGLLRSNVIIVSRSVLIQWEKAIANHTSLRVFTVSDKSRLEVMYRLYKAGQLNSYDIILVKNGDVTGNFVLDDELAKDVPSTRPLAGVIAKMTANNCFARVVVDDFDTSNMPAATNGINALSTIYVSATTKSGKQSSRVSSIGTIAELLEITRWRYNDALNDTTLFSNFNIRNDADYVEMSTRVPMTVARKCTYDNPNDKYMTMLGVMGADDAAQVMEMLNGDAIEEAAAFMGVKTTSVADIFQRVLTNKYDRYVSDRRALDAIAEAKTLEQTMPDQPTFTGRDIITHTAKLMERVSTHLAKGQTLTAEMVGGYTSTTLRMTLESLYANAVEAEAESSKAISNIVENIKDSDGCQVCLLPFDGVGAFINKCCGAVICDDCGIRGNRFDQRYDYKSKQQTLVASCCSCKRQIYPQNDMIYISKEFDISTLLSAKGFSADTPGAPVHDAANADDKAKSALSPKLAALAAIIRGEQPENAEQFEHSVKHLLVGKHDMGWAPAGKRKVLVFTNFAESVRTIEEFMVRENIEYLRLNGTAAEINSTVQQFESYGKVLLINSSRHCAGLNLQFATDLVFFHKIIDPNVESQVAGRAIRIAREYNLAMWWLLYRNEERIIGH